MNLFNKIKSRDLSTLDKNYPALLTIYNNSPNEEKIQLMHHYIHLPYDGVIHSLTDHLADNQHTIVFNAILEELSLNERLDQGVYTVFAPVDCNSLSSDEARYHIVEGSYPRFYLERLKYLHLCMMNDKYIQFWGDDTTVCIKDETGTVIRFVGEPIYCKNGIVHLIDKNFSIIK